MKEAFESVVKTDNEHDRIMSFMFFCKVSGIEQEIFNLILFSAVTTFCNKLIYLIEQNLSKNGH